MTVKLHGSIDDREYRGGQILKEKFEKDTKLTSPENQVHIVTSVQCYGQQPKDIDLVVFGSLNDYSTKVKCKVRYHDNNIGERDVKISNFCVVIEVKGHDPEGLYFLGTKLIAKYPNKSERDVTYQSQRQKFSLRNYLEDLNLWVSNLIFLPHYSRKQLNEEVPDEEILFSDFDISDFWHKLFLQRWPEIFNSQVNYSPMDPKIFKIKLDNYLKKLTKEIKTTRLDRERIERICRETLKNQKYETELGKQLLIFRGCGGTGKTYNLLNLAWNVYNKYSHRVLILTYNKALVADIRRLLAIMKIPDGIDASVQIKSIYQYWYEVLYATGIRTRTDIKISSGHSDAAFINEKASLKNYLKSALVSEEAMHDLNDLSINKPDLFSWNHILIDEAQDWPDDERDLIYTLFSPNKIIIADGVGQLVRNTSACDWANSPYVKEKQIVNLKTSLRQKPNLTRFIKEITEKLGLLYDWDVIDNDGYNGGKVVILERGYSKKFHDRLMKQNKDDKNENIDMLFCVPPENVNINHSIVGDTLDEWGYSVWDGVGDEIRKSYPTNLNQFRIVQYDSSRGLEGWICVNIAFDKFYKYKLEIYETPKAGQMNFKSPEERRKEFAARWLLIPLTRAIDTLVLHIEDPNSHISRILKEIHSNNPEYIEWISE